MGIIRYDSYGRSTYLVKEKDTDGGKLKCGPPWDYDRAMDYFNPPTTNGWVWEITHPYWPFPFWWSRMWEDPDYRKQLACRWTMLRQNTLQTAAFMTLIDTLKAEIEEGQERNFRVWNNLGAMSYEQHIDSLKSYVTRRLNWIDATLAAEQVSIPQFYLPSDTLVCAGSVFDAEAAIGHDYSYNWQPGPDTSVITFPNNGAYNLVVTDAHGCYASKTMNVIIAAPGDASFSSQQVDSSAVWTFHPNDLNASSYLWDFGDGNTSTAISPAHQYAALGAYIVTLTVMDSNACPAQSAQDSILFFTSGALEQLAFEGRIYPNPFRETIQVYFAQPATGDFTISLENELGQQVLSSKYPSGTERCSIATDQIPTGLYWLLFTERDRVWGLKVLRL